MASMSVACLLSTSREELLKRVGRVPFKELEKWRVSVGLAVPLRTKDYVEAVVLGYFSSCLRTEAFLRQGFVFSEVEGGFVPISVR